ncbi:MAG: uracil-DNA glycosylase [Planctomycetes bacterium]|nr:uracil-DNA glycosylase [Planctomycetota bacterium]
MDAGEGRGVRQRLESLARAGVETLPARGRGAASSAVPPATARPVPDEDAAPATMPSHTLAVLRDEVAACTRCTELASQRTRTVFGTGRADARLVFFGEAPGADEDVSGEPFVGRAGQLLTKIIEACTLRREDVYIMNVLKCRPPGNRAPLPEEVRNCRPFFERQFEIIRPEFICCLGASAAQSLLESTETIGKLRGRWFSHGSAQVICTYHPSYLLRNPAAKRDVWEDMKVLMARMGVELSNA